MVALGLLLVLVLLMRPALHLLFTANRDVDERTPPPPGTIDDASRLNRTAVAEVWPVPPTSGAERELAAVLERARELGLPVSIAGARHSMGGHTFYPGGLVVDMRPHVAMELDESRDILRVQSGALWSDVIPYLDARGRSVAVMQSNNSFSVGGSLSVNCHGWQFDRGPIASTVESLRLMQADGSIVRCARTENAELFSLVLGGYGLFGIILDVELRVVENERYRLEQHVVPLAQSLATFDRRVDGEPDVRMVYARLCIVPDRLFDEVIISAFFMEAGEVPELSGRGLPDLRRAMFRGSVGSDYGKHLRWSAETEIEPLLTDKSFSRNQLLNEGVAVFENRTEGSTDVLHEYFVPRTGVVAFVKAMREIIPAHDADLLNVTVRSVNRDEDTFLRYADQRMIAFVMLFTQARTEAGEADMRTMTRGLIEAAIAAGGRHYLPYRLHATRDQFHRAYPQARRFFELKRHYDPNELFRNGFYRTYGAE
ncbi:MAG: FAD-binding oxidoreductase [Planctomycetota bacterium]|nr:MAG: FAD-binding oxidoreductase [Planctomycetota bacterium]